VTEVADVKVVGTEDPLTRITVLDMNPVPVKVIGTVAPSTAWVGLADLRVGTGFTVPCAHTRHVADMRKTITKVTFTLQIAPREGRHSE
jgi:hypothetical protein